MTGAEHYVTIDPGLRSTGIWRRSPEGQESDGFTVGAKLPRLDALSLIAKMMEQRTRKWAGAGVQFVAVEQYAFAAQGSAITTMAEVGGIIRAIVGLRLPIVEVAIPTWKAVALRGFKPDKAHAEGRAHYITIVKAVTGQAVENHDAADACMMSHALHIIAAHPEARVLKGGAKRLREEIDAILSKRRAAEGKA